MANVIATLSNVDVSVTTTNNIITVAEADSGSIVSNIVLSNNLVSVGTTQNNILVAEGIVDISTFRASLSNIAPILYNSESGVISIDANALFSGKTTDDLAEGNTNLYYTVARANSAIGAYQGNINTVGSITATNLTATSNISAGNLTVTGALNLNTIVANTGNITTVNATTVNATTLTGTLSTAAQPNITSLGTLTSLSVQGAAVVNNNITGNILTANNYVITPDLYLGPVSTITNKRIIAYGNSSIANHSASGQLYYDPDFANEITSPSQRYGRWFFQNDTTGVAFPIPTSTTDLVEGANLYYTTARANSAIAAYQGTISTVGNITTTANISGGNVIGTYLRGDGSNISGIIANRVSLSAASGIQYVLLGNVTAPGPTQIFNSTRLAMNFSSNLISLNGNTDVSGYLSVGGAYGTNTQFEVLGNNVTVQDGNIIQSGQYFDPVSSTVKGMFISSPGNITSTGGFFVGDGRFLSNVTGSYGNANVANFLSSGYGSNTITTSGTITAGTLNANTITAPAANIDIARGKSLRFLDLNANITGDASNVSKQNLDVTFNNITFKIGRSGDVGDNFKITNRSTGNVLFKVGADTSPEGSDNDEGVTVYGNLHIGTESTSTFSGGNIILRTNGDIDLISGSGNGFVFANKLSTVGNVTAGGYFIGDGSLLSNVSTLTNAQVVSYIATQPLTVGGNLQVNGNLDVTGNVNYQNVTDLYVRDQIIVLNANAVTNSNVQIISNRPTATNTNLKWNEQATRWEFTNDGTTYYPIPTSTTDLIEGANLYFTTDRANTNSNAWLTTKTTSNLTEGANLYYTTARANSAIGAYQGAISTAGNITTTANVSGQYILGNGAFLTGITSGGTVTQINTGENLTGGPITTTGTIGMANALANVNSVSSETAANLTLATNKQITVTTRQRNGNVTHSANITGEGFGVSQTGDFFNAPFFSYSGLGELKALVFDGSITTGSNVITGVANIHDLQGNPLSISNVTPYHVIIDSPLSGSLTLFPPGTYVVSASGSNIFMSANALYTETLIYDSGDPYSSFGTLNPGAYDSTTGLLVGLETAFDYAEGDAQTIYYNFLTNYSLAYGYGPNGPIPSNFAYSIGTGSDYAIDTNVVKPFLFARTDFSADKTVGNFRRGLTIGDADLTNRGENDGNQTFGLNIVWDGTSDPAVDYGESGGILPQMLLKQYTTGTYQATSLSDAGPRMLFISANGKNTDNPLSTYARKNQELGRISWLSTTSALTTPSSLGPPAYISAVAGQDNTATNSGVGMYFAASPNTANFNRSLYLASSMGNTLVSSAQDSTGTHRPIIFAPSHVMSSQGNAVLLYNQTVNGTDTITDTTQTSGAHFAQINFNDTANRTGAKVSVTNGNNFNSNREGNIALSIDRNSTTANTTVRARSGATNYYGNNNPDRVRFTFTPDGLADGTAVTIAGFTNSTVAGALNGNVFYVKGIIASGVRYYELYTDSGLTTGVNLGVTNINAGPGTFTYARTNGVTAKDWSLVLPQSSNSLILTEDGVTRTTFEGANITTAGNVAASTFLGNIAGTTGNFTGNVTAGNTIVNGVAFNTTSNIAPTSGQIRYNTDYGTHQVGLDGSNIMLMGQDLVVYARNDEANTLLKGEVVYIAGASGDKATIKRAVNNSDANSATTIGIVKSDIAVGQLGYVVSQGVVDGLNLTGYASGEKVYLGNVAGTFTNIKPQSPEHYVFIGVVEKANPGSGQILVRVQNGFELDEIHDVNVTNVQPNDILFRNAGNTLWVNQNLGTTLTNTNITLKQFNETRVDLGSTGGNITLNMANGSIFAMTATSNISNIALSNASIGSSGTLIITQDGTGSKTLTTTSAWKFAGGSKTLTTTANAIDIVNFFTDGTTVFAALSKGYS